MHSRRLVHFEYTLRAALLQFAVCQCMQQVQQCNSSTNVLAIASVGVHMTQQDLRVMNLAVRPSQVVDTSDLWSLPGQRKVCLCSHNSLLLTQIITATGKYSMLSMIAM
jgi:hypothetical protein